jgi:hypothetical protein
VRPRYATGGVSIVTTKIDLLDKASQITDPGSWFKGPR